MFLVSGCRAQRDLNNSQSLSLNSKRVSSPGASERQGSGFRRKKKPWSKPLGKIVGGSMGCFVYICMHATYTYIYSVYKYMYIYMIHTYIHIQQIKLLVLIKPLLI